MHKENITWLHQHKTFIRIPSFKICSGFEPEEYESHSRVGVGLLDRSEEDAVVVVLEHGLGVLTVHCFVVGDLFLELEPGVLDQGPHDVVARLDAGLFGDVSEMVKQGAKVDPSAAWLQDPVDQLDEF